MVGKWSGLGGRSELTAIQDGPAEARWMEPGRHVGCRSGGSDVNAAGLPSTER